MNAKTLLTLDREKKRKLLSIAGTLALLVWTLFLFRLNYRRIYDNTFWLDENWSIRLARMPLGEMLALTASDMHPPLYYLLAMALNRLLGDNGVAYHLSGLVPYMGILALACTEVRRHYGLGAAFVLVAMSSILSQPLYYNVEARMYSLGAFLVLAAYLALRRMLTRNRWPEWVIFSLASLGAAYTHYYALIIVAFFYLILVVPSIRDRGFRRRTAITWAAAVVGYLPWLGVLLRSFVSTSGDWWLTTIPSVGECLLYLLDNWYLAGGFLLAAGLFCLTEWKKAGKGLTPDALWVLAGLLSLGGTMAVGLGLSHATRPLFLVRFVYPLAPVTYLLLGWCLSRLDKTRVLPFLLAAAVVAGSWQSYLHIRDDSRYLDNRTQEFLEQVQPGENAAIYTEVVADFRYYFPDVPEFIDPELDDLDTSYDEIWVFRVVDEEPEDLPGFEKEKVVQGVFADWVEYYVWRYTAA